MSLSAIPKVEPGLLGPPNSTLVNPTFWLFVACFGAFWTSISLHAYGALPLALAVGINTVCLYVIYTVTHEAIHGIAHSRKWLNELMGRIAAAMEGISLPLIRGLHFQHHAFTNDPKRDPDYIIGRRPRLLLPVWAVVRLTHDNLFALRTRLWSKRNARLAEHLTTLGLQISLVTATAYTGHLKQVLVLWLLPVVISGITIELTVAWLVHYPHTSRHPLEHTRLIQGRLWRILMLNQNVHLVHHLWPRLPWFRYAKALSLADCAVRSHQRKA